MGIILMLHIAIGFFSFLVTVFVQVVVSRVFHKRGALSAKSLLIFPIGAILTGVVLFLYPQTDSALPLTGFFLNATLSFVFMIYAGGVFMKESSPSGTIYSSIKQYGPKSHEAILNLFSDHNLIMSRLQMLIHSGLVVKKRDKYLLTSKGLVLAKVFQTLHTIYGWERGG